MGHDNTNPLVFDGDTIGTESFMGFDVSGITTAQFAELVMDVGECIHDELATMIVERLRLSGGTDFTELGIPVQPIHDDTAS